MSRRDVIDSKGEGSNGSGTFVSLNSVEDQKLEFNLWQEAMGKVKLKWIPPAEWQIDTSDSKKVVENIQQEAQARAKKSEENHSGFHLTGGKEITYRKMWDKIVSYSKEFQVVGDILIQADPGYAALPWALIRFAIATFGSESDTYNMMLEGVDFVSRIITQYTVIERLYAREGSKLSALLIAKAESKLSHELRESLVSLYVNVLQYQTEALRYFDAKKWSRTLTGMNPILAARLQDSRNAVDSAMKDVDRLAALIHQHASILTLDELLIGKDELKDGLQSLAKETGNVLREHEILLKRILLRDTTQKWQNTVLDLASQLQEKREIEELLNVRTWVSATQPEEVRKQAEDKRPLPLGNWLLVHPQFERWRSSPKSSLLWMHGFAGTGKTGLALRVIDSFRSEPKDTLTSSRLAFFFCSNDTAGTGSGDDCSRADPEEALRSIVSQLSTAKEGTTIAPTLYQKYSEFCPKSNRERRLDYSDCVEIILAISSDARVTIVLDAFDDKSPNNVRVFIFTRCFAAIEKELSPELSIEVTSENNGDDVREFISTTIKNRIDGKKLLKGVVSDPLKAFIMKTLTDRADNMFLYASLLMDQLCDQSRHDNIINLLLENKPPALVSTPGGCYGSALVAAIFSRDSDSVWTLLEEGAHPNAKDKIHGYPLVMATTMGQGHQEIVSLLLKKEATADLTHQDNSLHLLHQAAKYGMIELAEHCLESGNCDINMTTTEGSKYHIWLGDVLKETTPLAFACAEGKEEMVRYLLSKNAAIKFPLDDSSALWAAAYSGHAIIVDLIVKAFEARHDAAETRRFINQPCHAGQASALWLAAMSGSVGAVIRLLDLKADFKGDSFNITPFIVAATCDRPKVIELLFKYHREGEINGNLSIDERDKNGKTAIFEACARNLKDTTEVLLDLGADYSIPDNSECIPLHAANRGDRDNIALITMLVEYAPKDLNTSKFQRFLDHKNNLGGKTVLMAAAERNRSCVIKLLLNHGANYSIFDNSDFTALHYCASRGQEAAVRTLLEWTSKDTTTNNRERFKKFLNQQGTENKASALIDASSGGHTKVVQLLFEYGAAYDCYDACGHSPLHQAVINGHHEVCQLILEQAVKDKDGDEAKFKRFLNARSIFDKTALDEANDRNSPMMRRCFEKLRA